MRRRFSLALLGLSLLAGTAHALDRAGARPQRADGSNLPPPQSWQGSMDDFDPGFWQHGVWRHGLHDHRLGWWYKVRMDWFAFDEPILPFPDMFTPTGQPVGWWYWCDPSREYYPYVTSCSAPWNQMTQRLG